MFLYSQHKLCIPLPHFRLVLLLPKVKMSELDRLLSDMPESEVDQIGRPGVAPASLVLPEGDLFHDRCV